MMHRPSCPTLALCLFSLGAGLLCPAAQTPDSVDRFAQLDSLLPPPSAQRTASGAPGPGYWQQRVDYDIDVALDEPARRISGKATITYHNHSPDPLAYLWLQLDRNLFARNSHGWLTSPAPDPQNVSFRNFAGLLARETFDGGFTIEHVLDAAGRPLPHAIVGTMMRIDLPEPLAPETSVSFSIAWSFSVNDARILGVRTGFETFGDDDAGARAVYNIAQWFPRLAAYTDYTGWQIKPYLASGEFALEFGDYTVRLTVPADHIVGATGLLQNADAVLSAAQRARLREAGSSRRPVFVVTPEEARAAEKSVANGTKTWIFRAENVRDFAFATSRSFIWDAMGVEGQSHRGPPVLAMSLYPKEGLPLWDKFATHAIAHAITVFSRHTFPYPYPVAIAVLGGTPGGMEYPMICFNGPRPEADGTYPRETRDFLIRVVIHEVGHNYFPMIVNSDERQWFWLDEGLNTFVEGIAMREWDDDPHFDRARLDRIIPYLRRRDRVPVMTAADSVVEKGPNAYGQPQTALEILREVVLGRKLFDFAFRTYAQRWMFRRPTPADFFRTMEDASGVDLDWFWRGWFFSTDHVDVSIERVRRLQLDSRNPAVEKPARKAERDARPRPSGGERDVTTPRRATEFPELADFYSDHDPFEVTAKDTEAYQKLLDELRKERIDPGLLTTEGCFYLVDFKNVGGLVTPLPLRITYADGTSEDRMIPAEIWRTDSDATSRLLIATQEIASIVFDPREELTDTDVENNHWPRRFETAPLRLEKPETRENPMRDAREATEPAADD